MEAALHIFFNGVIGVVAGMGTLYLAIKLLAVIGQKPAEKQAEE